MPKEGDTGARLISRGLTLEFVWCGDRYQHSVSVGLVKLTSSDPESHESPVFTDLHRQDDTLFLSGMSGDRHWSASVEPTADGWGFDVACRLRSPWASLGSAYAPWNKNGLQLIGKATGDCDSPSLSTANGVFTVTPAHAGEGFPTTLRYRFEIVKPRLAWVSRSD